MQAEAQIKSALWGALLVGAIALRAIGLGDRPLQFDEAQIAYFSWRFLETGDFAYDPLLHGPLQYFLNAGAFALAGTSDAVARLVSAIAGVALVALPLGLRARLGTVAAFAAAVALAFSPAFAYYTRFAREDALEAALLLALLVVAVRLLDRPRRWHPAAAGALLAALFATKESTFITVAIAGAGLLGAMVGGWPVRPALAAVGGRAWLGGLVSFVGVFVALFSTFGTHPEGVLDGAWRGPRYWAAEHDVGRGNEEWSFYVIQLVAQEPLVLILGIAGIAVAIRRREPLALWLAWWFAASLVVYSYAGERFAWLTLHPLLPLCLLAGVGVQGLWDRLARRPRHRAAAALVLAVGAGLMTWSAIGSSHLRSTDPRELLVVNHTDEDVLEIRDAVIALVAQRPHIRVIVGSGHDNAFPWAWYLRDLPVLYGDLGGALPRPHDIVITTADAPVVGEAAKRDWDVREFTLRRGWIRDYDSLTVGGLARWALYREPWSPTGELRGVLIRP